MKSTIACPTCGQANPAGSLFCVKCNARLPGADDFKTIGGELSAGTPLPPLMERGTRLANGRYEILAILGQGAMRAENTAKDHELDRWVAIKVIQSELANSPSSM